MPSCSSHAHRAPLTYTTVTWAGRPELAALLRVDCKLRWLLGSRYTWASSALEERWVPRTVSIKGEYPSLLVVVMSTDSYCLHTLLSQTAYVSSSIPGVFGSRSSLCTSVRRFCDVCTLAHFLDRYSLVSISL